MQLRRQVEHIGKTQVVYRFLISNFQKREYLRLPQVLGWILNVYFLNTTKYTKNSTLCLHHFLCYILSLILEECLYSIISAKKFGICALPHLGQLALSTGVGLVSWPQGSHIHLLCLLPHLFFMGCYSLSCKKPHNQQVHSSLLLKENAFCCHCSTRYRTKIPLNIHQSNNLKHIYRGADKFLARPTSRCILFDGENILFDASLVIYI